MTQEPPFTDYNDFLQRTVRELEHGIDYSVNVNIERNPKDHVNGTIRSKETYQIFKGNGLLEQFIASGPNYDYSNLKEIPDDEREDQDRMLQNIDQLVAQETKYQGIKKQNNSFKLMQYGEDVPKGKQIPLI